MMRYGPLIFTGVALAAGGPLLLHGHPARDCNPRVALCALSDASYMPDEPAPEHAPQLIFEPPATASVSSVSIGAYPFTTFKT